MKIAIGTVEYDEDELKLIGGGKRATREEVKEWANSTLKRELGTLASGDDGDDDGEETYTSDQLDSMTREELVNILTEDMEIPEDEIPEKVTPKMLRACVLALQDDEELEAEKFFKKALKKAKNDTEEEAEETPEEVAEEVAEPKKKDKKKKDKKNKK